MPETPFDIASPVAFRDVADEATYRPVADDCHIAVTDVVGSRKAIAEGRYKAVNMAGVAVIAAAMNALRGQSFPFVFGGDGACLLVAPENRSAVRRAMRQVAAWARSDLGLELRVAMVPVEVVRNAGYDVRVAAFRVSEDVVNYAFCGGGASHAEALMKRGRYMFEPEADEAPPDLEGLSCRWTPVEAEGHKVVSLIVEARDNRALLPAALTLGILDIARGEGGSPSPMPVGGPGFVWPPEGLELEARAARKGGDLAAARRRIRMITLIAWVLDRTRISVGGFDPIRYKSRTSANTDYRKIQDGLKMTLCLDAGRLAALEALLKRHAGTVRHGLCVQDRAVLTCFVPSITDDTHYHFLDGTGGGYAAAATAMGAGK